MLTNRFFWFLLIAVFAGLEARADETCGSFTIRYRHFNKIVNQNLEGCSKQSPQGLLFTSVACSSECPMKTTLRKTTIPENQIFRATGSPHFHVCHIMGWQPKILEIQIGSDWKKTSICEDTATGDFLDANSLLKIVLKK